MVMSRLQRHLLAALERLPPADLSEWLEIHGLSEEGSTPEEVRLSAIGRWSDAHLRCVQQGVRSWMLTAEFGRHELRALAILDSLRSLSPALGDRLFIRHVEAFARGIGSAWFVGRGGAYRRIREEYRYAFGRLRLGDGVSEAVSLSTLDQELRAVPPPIGAQKLIERLAFDETHFDGYADAKQWLISAWVTALHENLLGISRSEEAFPRKRLELLANMTDDALDDLRRSASRELEIAFRATGHRSSNGSSSSSSRLA